MNELRYSHIEYSADQFLAIFRDVSTTREHAFPLRTIERRGLILNRTSLETRIANLQERDADTSEEERALKALKSYEEGRNDG